MLQFRILERLNPQNLIHLTSIITSKFTTAKKLSTTSLFLFKFHLKTHQDSNIPRFTTKFTTTYLLFSKFTSKSTTNQHTIQRQNSQFSRQNSPQYKNIFIFTTKFTFSIQSPEPLIKTLKLNINFIFVRTFTRAN